MTSRTSPQERVRKIQRFDRLDKNVTIEVNFSIKVVVVEKLHGDLLLALVNTLQLWIVNSNVFLDSFSGKNDLLVLPWSIYTHEGPVANSCRRSNKDKHEEIRLETTILHDGKERLCDVGDNQNESSEVKVVERAIALCKAHERRIFHSWVVGYPHR